MGCDIHSHAEVRTNGRWVHRDNLRPDAGIYDGRDEPFYLRSYGVFGFLADVRNYSHSPVIVEPRGIPADASPEVRADWGDDGHSASWLTLAELLAYDYDQTFWDRRITRGGNGAALAEKGEGTHPTLREFLGGDYFAALDLLRTLADDPADVRVVFWFDN